MSISRRRSRGRRPRRKGMWLNAIGLQDCSVGLTRNVCGENFDPTLTDLFLLVDNPTQFPEGSVSTVGEATVVRLVGELDIFLAYAGVTTGVWWTNVAVAMGIYVVDADSFGTVLPRSPAADVENGDWMWRGSYFDSQCGQGTAVGNLICTENDLAGEGTNANGSHIDIRVKRKLKREESIVLAIDVLVDDIIVSSTGNPTVAARLNGNVRAYVLEP